MATQGNQVKFFYAASTTALPATRDADTIYFDAQAKAIYVGSQIIAADNASQDLSSFVTNTALAATLNDYVTKNGATINRQLLIDDPNGVGTWYINRETTGFSFSMWDDPNDTMADAKLSGIATPTASSDAATKGYVDAQIVSAGPTWTVG